jgi:phosphatidylglycerophosphate synthase
MSRTWGMIDARDSGATRRVGGISLISRQVRQAQRARWAGAVVWTSDRAPVEAALRRDPPPAGFSVEIQTDAAPPAETGDRDFVHLDGRAVYTPEALRSGREPEPTFIVQNQADAREAEQFLMRTLRKSILADGVIAYYLMRPISRLISRLLVNTQVTPNQVTLIAMAFGVAAAVAAAGLNIALAGALLWAGAAIDCVDGELARLRLQGSKLGEWLDTVADDVSSFGVLFGVCYGLYMDGYHHVWLWIGVVGAIVGFASQAKLYLDLHRMGLPIDTSQYPWFLGKPSGGMGGTERDRGFIGWIVYACSFFFRRDAFVTMLAIFFALDWRRFAVGVMLLGVVIILALIMIHEVVTAFRRSTSDA